MLGGHSRPRQSVEDRKGPFYETQRDVKMETTFMSYVPRRKLNFQQLEHALGTPLPAVIKGYATFRDAKLAESSCERGGDVDRWQLRLRRRHVSTGAVGSPRDATWNKWAKRQDRTDIFHKPGSGCINNRSRFRDLDTTKYGPTTLERDSRRTARGRRFLRGRRDDNRTRWSNRHSGVFYITDDGQEVIEENEVPQILLQARPAFRHPRYRAIREDLNVVQKSRCFFGPRRSASGRDQGPRMKRSSI